LQLEVLETKVYHNFLLNTKTKIQFAFLRQINVFEKTEEDNDMSWECHEVIDYCREKGDNHSSN
jgi:hypothetical protein